VPAPCNAAFGGPQQVLQVLRLLALCTKVQTLTPKELQPQVLSLLALLVQKYEY
jgi:hypothetical protein